MRRTYIHFINHHNKDNVSWWWFGSGSGGRKIFSPTTIASRSLSSAHIWIIQELRFVPHIWAPHWVIYNYNEDHQRWASSTDRERSEGGWGWDVITRTFKIIPCGKSMGLIVTVEGSPPPFNSTHRSCPPSLPPPPSHICIRYQSVCLSLLPSSC